MGYKDIFDDSFSTPASDKSEESSAVTPLTPEPEEQQQSKPLLFPGFGSVKEFSQKGLQTLM